MNPRALVDELDARDPWLVLLESILNKANGILNKADGGFSMNLRALVDDIAIVDEPEARTELDCRQCQALIAALTREFAFI
jgi:hypothetical protein